VRTMIDNNNYVYCGDTGNDTYNDVDDDRGGGSSSSVIKGSSFISIMIMS